MTSSLSIGNLPRFLGGGSPPRSPHTARRPIWGNYFPLPTNSTLSNPANRDPNARLSHFTLRPTRRDILLCLLTLSFSYLLMYQVPTSDAVGFTSTADPGSSSGYRLPSWKTIFGSGCSDAPRELTFGESVRTYGVSLEYGAGRGKGPGASAGSDLGDLMDEPVDPPSLELAGAEMGDELEGMLTVLRGHQPGWTLMDQVYVYNGSLYVVTLDRSKWPELIVMISTGLPASNEEGNGEARKPKGHEITFITPLEAARLWGPRVYKMDGTTWLFNDGQFIDHYYHFAAELLLGSWRAYSSLDSKITSGGETTLPPPRRAWFLHQNSTQWRDKPRVNPTLLFALFPSISTLYPEDWEDLKNQTVAFEPKAFLLERALLADRSAAFYGPLTGPTSRTAASALALGSSSRWWWEPIRRQVLRYSSLPQDVLDRSLEGYGQRDVLDFKGSFQGYHFYGEPAESFLPLVTEGHYAPTVTYISRQHSRRRLTEDSHADLVAKLEERSRSVGFEFVVVEAEKLTHEEQFALAGRTTIMLGVHGNGLTHLIWMPATPRSTVIELFFRGGFARDYQWTAHALGMKHYGVQHDRYFTAPDIPDVEYPEGFHGTEITVDGKMVADLVEGRLTGTI